MKRIAAILIAATVAVPVWADTKPVTPTDQVQFQQQTISAQMQELQDRMFRLSELTKSLEPDDSAKLVLAVQRAREELIVEQMKDVIDQLGRGELAKAGDDQRQVLVKLETLKQLLLNSELDLAAQLKQLQKLEAAIKKIDAITKQQQEQRARTDEQTKKPETPKMAAIQKDQTATSKATETVTQSVQSLGEGAAGAAKALSSAGGKMGSAAKGLGGNKPGDAVPQQDGALKDLAEARKQLDEQRQKIVAQLEQQVRKQVIANLTDMLDRQKSVRETVTPMYAAVQKGDREAQLSVRRLALAEQRIVTINDQTLTLIRETEFSIALPPTLEEIGRRMTFLQSDFDAGRAGPEVEDKSKVIERDLTDLIDTFKQLANSSNKQSNCRGCKGNKNKLLAELKTLRLLQTRVNQATTDVDKDRAAMAELSPELRAKVGTAAEQQRTAFNVADKIAKALAPDAPTY